MGLILTLSNEDLRLMLRLLPVTVKGREDQSLLPLLPWHVRAGIRVDVPSWAARLLEAEGKVEVEEGEHTIRELDRLIHKEDITARPTKMSDSILRWMILRLGELGKTGPSQDLEKLSLAARELGIKRITKIVKYAVLSLEYPDIEKKIGSRLTLPERVVYGQVREIIADWLSLEVGGGGRR